MNLLLSGLNTSELVDDLKSEGLSLGNDFTTILGGNVVGNLNSVLGVVHDEHIEVLDLGDL